MDRMQQNRSNAAILNKAETYRAFHWGKMQFLFFVDGHSMFLKMAAVINSVLVIEVSLWKIET